MECKSQRLDLAETLGLFFFTRENYILHHAKKENAKKENAGKNLKEPEMENGFALCRLLVSLI